MEIFCSIADMQCHIGQRLKAFQIIKIIPNKRIYNIKPPNGGCYFDEIGRITQTSILAARYETIAKRLLKSKHIVAQQNTPFIIV